MWQKEGRLQTYQCNRLQKEDLNEWDTPPCMTRHPLLMRREQRSVKAAAIPRIEITHSLTLGLRFVSALQRCTRANVRRRCIRNNECVDSDIAPPVEHNNIERMVAAPRFCLLRRAQMFNTLLQAT